MGEKMRVTQETKEEFILESVIQPVLFNLHAYMGTQRANNCKSSIVFL